MNSKSKRRIGVVAGVIVIVTIAVIAIIGSNTAARTVSVIEAIGFPDNVKIQVTGNVVENSFQIQGNSVTFDIYDPETDPAASNTLHVRYDSGVSATFGNDVTAICTGKKDAAGTLNCTELVTKCPSKYESAESALTIDELLSYGDAVVGKPVKVFGIIKEGTLAGVDADERFILVDTDSGSILHVRYGGAIPDGIAEDGFVVLTGSVLDDGTIFAASDIASNE